MCNCCDISRRVSLDGRASNVRSHSCCFNTNQQVLIQSDSRIKFHWIANHKPPEETFFRSSVTYYIPIDLLYACRHQYESVKSTNLQIILNMNDKTKIGSTQILLTFRQQIFGHCEFNWFGRIKVQFDASNCWSWSFVLSWRSFCDPASIEIREGRPVGPREPSGPEKPAADIPKGFLLVDSSGILKRIEIQYSNPVLDELSLVTRSTSGDISARL